MSEATMSKASSQRDRDSLSSVSTDSRLDMSLDESRRLPSLTQLEKAGDLPVLDKDGNSHTFRCLWDRKESTERRNIIVFVRHFFCGSCQEYVRTLASQLPKAGLYSRNPPSTLTIIGCGDPSLIPEYMTTTNCEFEVYADPTRALYIALGMTSNLGAGDRKPDYIKKSSLSSVTGGIWSFLTHPTVSPGKVDQNGGEWIFLDGALVWCHRMRNTRDHIEVDELKNILEGQKETGDRNGK